MFFLSITTLRGSVNIISARFMKTSFISGQHASSMTRDLLLLVSIRAKMLPGAVPVKQDIGLTDGKFAQ